MGIYESLFNEYSPYSPLYIVLVLLGHLDCSEFERSHTAKKKKINNSDKCKIRDNKVIKDAKAGILENKT